MANIQATLRGAEATQRLIELVRGHSPIYDVTSHRHMDAVYLANTWNFIANQLDIPDVTANDVKNRWRTLRDTYRKKKKETTERKRSGSGASNVSRWKYMDIMNFLEVFMREARTDSNVTREELSGDDTQDSCTQESDRNSLAEDETCPSPVPSNCSDSRPGTSNLEGDTPSRPTTPFVSPRTSMSEKQRKKKKTQLTEFEATFLDLAKTQSSRLERQYEEDKERHAMDAFFESCAMRAKELPKQQQSWLQMQVSMLMYSAESSDTASSSMSTHMWQSDVTPFHSLTNPPTHQEMPHYGFPGHPMHSTQASPVTTCISGNSNPDTITSVGDTIAAAMQSC